MQMINDVFTAHLSKFSAKVVDEDVYIEFGITHVSKNEFDQVFLDNYSDAMGNTVNKCLNDPEWDNIKFTQYVPNMSIKFDVMEFNATLHTIKISKKETAEDIIFKYDLIFLKKQDKDDDTFFATYLKHKDEDDDGKKYLTQYDVEMTV